MGDIKKLITYLKHWLYIKYNGYTHSENAG